MLKKAVLLITIALLATVSIACGQSQTGQSSETRSRTVNSGSVEQKGQPAAQNPTARKNQETPQKNQDLIIKSDNKVNGGEVEAMMDEVDRQLDEMVKTLDQMEEVDPEDLEYGGDE